MSCPEGTWFGIAFGPGMAGVDLAHFDCEREGKVTDMWGRAYGVPVEDESQDLVDTEIEHHDGVYKFVTYRKLLTDDKEYDL